MTQQPSSDQDVIIAGVGMTPVGEHWDQSIRELALRAVEATLAEAGGLQPEAIYVANMLGPALSRQAHLGALIADFAGLRGVEAVTVESAGASGGMALRQAYLALLAGEVESALVIGVEKISERVSAEVAAAVTTGSDADFEAIHGITETAQAALIARRYLHENGLEHEVFAGFSLNAHANGVANPYAMFRRAIKMETYQKAAMLSDPINMFDAAPLADGAAAILLTRGERSLPSNPAELPRVRIAASAAATDALALHDRRDPLRLRAAADSAERAYAQAGITPQEVDLFELHDRFSIYAALELEAAGFAERGAGWRLARNGAITRTGSIPICTMGGAKARGDTGGATGVYQAVEAVLQLQGRAGENQIEEAKSALVQCLGGTGGSAVTHILQRVDGD